MTSPTKKNLLFPPPPPTAPLAERMRPRTLAEFAGQRHLLGEGRFLSSVLAARPLPSLILWGPPGSGKTTLARLIASETGALFLPFSAVLSGIREIKDALETLPERRGDPSRPAILFVDEIHRFNKAQQDGLLPHVESGLVTLFGTTTENPSFEVRGALLSRCRVLVLQPLSAAEVEEIVLRALSDGGRGLGKEPSFLVPEALRHLVETADGDARTALNALEAACAIAASRGLPAVDLATAEEALRRKALLYDKDGEEHYNLISALHKALRGSDPDAALYWFCRMVEAGEDPLYVGRRMVRFASEDVGNAAPGALQVALSAVEAYRLLGSPEGELALAQCVLYLATAPKSNRAYAAFGRARREAATQGNRPVPMRLRNAPTRLMKELGYSDGYRYPHDFADAFVREDYFPDDMERRTFYEPSNAGHEKVIAERLRSWWGDRKGPRKGKDGGEG